MTRSINYYVEGRVFEWVMSLAMVLVGFELIIWPETIQTSAFRYLTLILSQYVLTILLLLIGWIRCAALMLNGQKMMGIKLGSYVRASGSVLSAIVWAQFVIALVQLSIVQGYPSFGAPFWVMFTVGEIYVAYTSVKNG